MNLEQVDKASFQIVTLIEAGATSAEVVSEARQYVDAWRIASRRDNAKQDFNKAVSVFQTNMQSTGEELRMRLPRTRRVERRGVRVTFPGENAFDSRVPLDGDSGRVRDQMLTFISVAEALATEMPEEDRAFASSDGHMVEDVGEIPRIEQRISHGVADGVFACDDADGVERHALERGTVARAVGAPRQ